MNLLLFDFLSLFIKLANSKDLNSRKISISTCFVRKFTRTKVFPMKLKFNQSSVENVVTQNWGRMSGTAPNIN